MPDETPPDTTPKAALPAPTLTPAVPAAPAVPQPPPAPAAETTISAAIWHVGLDPRQRILFAGLLASKPELADAQLSADGWLSALDAYETSPTETTQD